MAVRAPAVAGTFYSGDAAALASEIANFAVSPRRDARAVVAPHAGYAYSGETANLAISSLPPGTRYVIVMGPTHHVAFDGISIGSYSGYETPLGCCAVAQSACEDLLANCVEACFRPDVHGPEHALEVEIPLLQSHCPDAQLIPIVVGRLRPEGCQSVARALLPWAQRSDTAVVVSTDMTHYGPRFGYVPFSERMAPDALRRMDLRSVDHMLSGDLEAFLDWKEESGTTICGWLPTLIYLYLRRLLPEDPEGELLNYCNSGEVCGSWANAVGYAGIAYFASAVAEEGPTDEDKSTLLGFARDVIIARLRGDASPVDPDRLSACCGELSGGFVSLHRHGSLRGCIGTIEAVSSVVETVRTNAEAAAFRDPRFLPLTEEELEGLQIEISLLSVPRSIRDVGEFEIGRDGIILEVANRRAVFLPQVAPEQGWDRDETLRQLARKAGLSSESWRRPDAVLSVFTATVLGDGGAD